MYVFYPFFFLFDGRSVTHKEVQNLVVNLRFSLFQPLRTEASRLTPPGTSLTIRAPERDAMEFKKPFLFPFRFYDFSLEI